METEIQSKVLGYFAEHADFQKMTEAQRLSFFYLDSGMIDSLGIIEFVTYLEETFDVQLTAEDMQTAEFRTLGGIVELIKAVKGR